MKRSKSAYIVFILVLAGVLIVFYMLDYVSTAFKLNKF